MMVNRSPSGPSSLGFAVTLMVVPIVPIVTSLVSNPVTRRFVMALPRFRHRGVVVTHQKLLKR